MFNSDNPILLVGSGGLGCELLKLLSVSNFKSITVIDMDTVEKTNLNRQFLFDSNSINKYKAEMAAKKTMQYRKGIHIQFIIGNIITDTHIFTDSFFNQFKIIVNALDNIEARNFVNKVAIKLNIPLINGGTEGYIGTVRWHIRNKTPCYECYPKVTNKSIPVCSIRDRPQKIEHCVGWGKTLFEQIFNNINKDLADYSYLNYKTNVCDLIENLFDKEINKIKELQNEGNTTSINLIKDISLKKYFTADELSNLDQLALKEYQQDESNVLSQYDIPTNSNIKHLLLLFYHSYCKLQEKMKQTEIINFNKSDKDIIYFIYSSSNLRCYNFTIPFESRFKIEQLAGNIIPAIASTNNIIAAIQVAEIIKYFKGSKDLRDVNLKVDGTLKSVLSMEQTINPNCPCCSQENIAIFSAENIKIKIDFKNDNFNKVLQKINEILEHKIDRNIYKDLNVDFNHNAFYMEGDLDEEEMKCYNTIANKTLKEIISMNKMNNTETVEFMFCFENLEKGNKYFNVILIDTPLIDNESQFIGNKRNRDK